MFPCLGNDDWIELETVAIITSINTNRNAKGTTHISSTGDLSIPDFVKDDEGLYQCIWDNHKPYNIELKQYDGKCVVWILVKGSKKTRPESTNLRRA